MYGQHLLLVTMYGRSPHRGPQRTTPQRITLVHVLRRQQSKVKLELMRDGTEDNVQYPEYEEEQSKVRARR